MYEFYFERMQVWKEGQELAKQVYNMTKMFPSEEKYGIISQLKRAVISISNNIAEGSGRKTKKDQANYTIIAYSSLLETLNLLIFSKEMNWLNNEDYNKIRSIIERLSNKLNALKNTQLSKKS